MGYTHYWKNEGFTPEQWGEACEISRKIIDASAVPVQFEYDQDDDPEVSPSLIRFNGVEDDGHETFYLTPVSDSFSFCKTARKPYDEIVVAVLGALAEINPHFSWSSDGDAQDHIDGIALYQRALRT